MKLDFIDLGKLSIGKANMRYAKKAPDVSDILPTVRARGVLVPLIVRPNCAPDSYEIVAGARRYTAARLIAEEAGEAGEPVALPCAILDTGDDAAAIEASLIENVARLDPDEVTRWQTFTRLIREGRTQRDIAATFGLPDLAVKRILALGNLLPRIRTLYQAGKIDATTVRHLTLATPTQQRAWLALFDDPDSHCPTGHSLKSWLFGGQSIKTDVALFDVEASELVVIADLFGDDRYFADGEAFWTHQDGAIDAKRAALLEEGWSDVVIVPPSEHFHSWEYEKASKRKGGRVYIDVRSSGEVIVHDGYVSAREARRIAAGDSPDSADKVARPELNSTLNAYVDLHRHAAVRAALTGHPAVALRLMVAHAIAGSPLWSVRIEPQSARNEAVMESVESCPAEALFDEKRRAVLDLLGFSAEEPTVVGNRGDAGGRSRDRLSAIFQRLLDLPDAALMDVICIVMGETLAAGSAAVEAVGAEIGLDMAHYWQADNALFELLRDREVLTAITADLAGEAVATANAKQPGKVLKAIIRDHLAGDNGRAKVENWVPRWLAFPPAAYTTRGGVGSIDAAARVAAAPETPEPAAEVEPEQLAA
jgi:ParB family chromosome partitioning protein